ncbi:MAG: preprotein translocase subunit SecG [Bacteroidales bacterium]|nr:preprotein translocase subunit SecG [Bacteroidales bacterium]
MNAFIFVSVLILIACVLMILVVLVQNSKGGGLASNFSSSNQYMGVRKTADFLEKFTWGLAIAMFALCLFSIVVIPRGTSKSGKADTELRGNIDETTQPVQDFQAPPKEEK